jgi:hypothetical protein
VSGCTTLNGAFTLTLTVFSGIALSSVIIRWSEGW